MNKKERRLAAKAAATSTPQAKGITSPEVKTPAPAKEVKTPKAKNEAEKHLDKVNATGTIKKITDKKDLKYKYPEEANTLELRKKHRAGIRAKIKAFMKTTTTLMNIPEKERTPEQAKQLTKTSTEFEKFAKRNLITKKPVAEPAA